MENLRQTTNKAYIVGILKESKIEFKPAKTSGRLMGIGTLTVVVKTETGINEIKVKVQQFADKKDGSPNSLFKGLQTVANEYKSIVTVGEENADLIKIEGQIEDGTYYSTNKGDFIEKLDIKGTFISRLTDKNTPHYCKVGFEGYLSKITPVENELDVELIGIGYNGVAVPVTATIPQNLVPPFQGKYTVGCTATLNFNIINEVQVENVQENVGFGESLGEVIERHITKRVVFGGSDALYAGMPESISEDIVRQALVIRETNLETKKEDAEKSTAGNNMTQGFGSLTTSNFAENGAGGFNIQGVNMNTGVSGFPAGGFIK